jgi:hydrogenase maturation protein HypF
MSGDVVAVKGLGGYQLACDARNEAAVNKLRDRKRKSRKPFALMARDIEIIKKYCNVSPAEESLLTGRTAPIVLLKKRDDTTDMLPKDVAPGNRYIGFMLPYTPLHHLLFNHTGITAEGLPEALVMTSGNLSEEPIVIENSEAAEKLSGIADALLTHDREIYMRVDDSVTRVVGGIPRLIRRARGYAPEPIELASAVPDILAYGGELKNTLCLTKSNYAIISQHIGDLTNYEATGFFEETLKNLKRTFKAEPHIVAHDMHPDYLSTRFAQSYKTGDDNSVTLVPVQHHHAHVASCMAENGEIGRVIGVAFDGTGYGLDGNSWGSEFSIAGYDGFERFAHLNYIPLPGGDKAVKEPWRIALSVLYQTYGHQASNLFSSLKPVISGEKARIVLTMLERSMNSPLSCGMGRLFDAVSSLIGICDSITFEGEAAIALEMAATETAGAYPYSLDGSNPVIIGTKPLVLAIVDDINASVSVGEIAGKFHNTVTEMTINVCTLARENTGLEVVALSGGVFQNALLFGLVESGLKARGFRVISHSKVPTNDACISLGQAAVAAARVSKKSL